VGHVRYSVFKEHETSAPFPAGKGGRGIYASVGRKVKRLWSFLFRRALIPAARAMYVAACSLSSARTEILKGTVFQGFSPVRQLPGRPSFRPPLQPGKTCAPPPWPSDSRSGAIRCKIIRYRDLAATGPRRAGIGPEIRERSASSGARRAARSRRPGPAPRRSIRRARRRR